MELVTHQKFLLDQQRFILRVSLNRANAINALNETMVLELSRLLTHYENDKNLEAIFLEGSGDKGFCSGGDIRMFYQSATDKINPGQQAQNFFQAEYQLDLQLATYTKPIICWANGIVMGGGMGLFWAASHRIVLDDTTLAMPEISIGLYPDAGGSYYLNQIKPAYARFLALTACRMTASDLSHLKYQHFYIKNRSKDKFLNDFKAYVFGKKIKFEEMLNQYLATLSSFDERPSIFEKFDSLITQCCGSEDIQEIDKSLRDNKHPEDFKQLLNLYFSGSPLSAWLIVEQLKTCRQLTLQQCFEKELALSVACLKNGDLKEGVRALAIDKDRKPRWKYQSLASVVNGSLADFDFK